MRFTFTQEDLLRGKTVKPGWYDVEITAVSDTTAKSTGVSGVVITHSILNPGEFKGVPVDNRFWENAPGFSKSLVEALTGTSIKAGAAIELDEHHLKGKRVQCYIVNDKSNKGNMMNVIQDYRPAKSQAV